MHNLLTDSDLHPPAVRDASHCVVPGGSALECTAIWSTVLVSGCCPTGQPWHTKEIVMFQPVQNQITCLFYNAANMGLCGLLAGEIMYKCYSY